MTVDPFTLDLGGGRALHGFVHRAKRPGPRPTVVVCHGFKGFMEWGFFPHLAELLADRGFTAVRFNLTGSGMKPGDELVTDTEAFRTATYSRDTEELLALLDAVADGRVATGLVDAERVALLGHSRGGGTAVLAAASDAWRERLAALVTWSAVSTFDRLSAEEKEEWRRSGELPIVNARTGQTVPIDPAVLDDLETNHEALDILAHARRRIAPWLIVHGGADETVPAAEGRALAAAARPPNELLEITDAGHTLGAVHPFAGPTPHLIQALNATQTWFRRHLG